MWPRWVYAYAPTRNTAGHDNMRKAIHGFSLFPYLGMGLCLAAIQAVGALLKRSMWFVFEKNPHIRLSCKLVPVPYWEYERCLLKACKNQSKCQIINFSLCLSGKISLWDLIVLTEQ